MFDLLDLLLISVNCLIYLPVLDLLDLDLDLFDLLDSFDLLDLFDLLVFHDLLHLLDFLDLLDLLD